MIERFSRIELLQNYLAEKSDEIDNRIQAPDLSSPVNGQQLTNLGIFRIYITQYLSHHPQICHDMLCMVRHLAPCEYGIPMEIYAFTSTTEWTEYESIQADILDHIYAIISEFGLRIYQKPSSADFHKNPHFNNASNSNTQITAGLPNTITPENS